jgi:hypothetical protein
LHVTPFQICFALLCIALHPNPQTPLITCDKLPLFPTFKNAFESREPN